MLSCVAALLMVVAGCKKSQPAAETQAPAGDPSAQTVAVPSPRGPPPTVGEVPTPIVANNSDINAVLNDLSLELRKYVVRTHTVPKTFEEFAEKSHVQMPPPPPGKKYAIQGQVIVLVKS
jgi:ABC-type enterochelin transport system substrate-binding protein